MPEQGRGVAHRGRSGPPTVPDQVRSDLTGTSGERSEHATSLAPIPRHGAANGVSATMMTTEEYEALVSHAAVVDRDDRGHVRVTGRDAVSFTDSLVSQDVAAL